MHYSRTYQAVSIATAWSLGLLFGCSATSKIADVAAPLVAHDLGSGRCLGVNRHGQVVGIDENEATFIIEPDGTRAVLAPPADSIGVIGIGVDDDGRVAGFAHSASGTRAVVFEGGTWRELASLNTGAEPMTISNGAVGGAIYEADGTPRAVLVTKEGVPIFPSPQQRGAVYAANGARRMAGIVANEESLTRAFVWIDGRLNILGTLGGPGSAALAMNERGDVVGASETQDGRRHAFFVAADTTNLVDLGVPLNTVMSDARGIDDRGNIAANASDAEGMQRAFLLQLDNPPRELLALDTDGAPYLGVHAVAMSGDGRVVGWGVPRVVKDGTAVHCLRWKVQP